MERATKLFVVLWTCAAIGAVVYFQRSEWTAFPFLTAAAFVLMAVAAAIDRRAVAFALALAYVYPVAIALAAGRNYFPFSLVWLAALLGAMLPDAIRSPWHVPRNWRPALICWALCIASAATIVVLREFDFTTALLDVRLANSSMGYPPNLSASWSIHVALVLLIGILWFDWLFGSRVEDFRNAVAWPLALSCAAMVAVALYQLFVDVTFLNSPEFTRFGRASGTVMDANVCGTIAALWIGGGALLLSASKTTVRLLLLGAAIAAGALAVWASGSRTALAAAVVVLAFTARGSIRSMDFRRTLASARARVMAALAIAVAGVLLYVAVSRGTSAAGPLDRLRDLLPDARSQSASRIAAELWDRNGYGSIAATMIRFAPMFGVGVGSFHVMQADFSRLGGLPVASPDNAQNWFRHQLAEFGVVGSIGWIIWVIAFAGLVLRSRPGARPHAHVARGMVIAFAAISLVGMPGQELPTALTFWTAAFWYTSLVGRPEADAIGIKLWQWWTILGVVAIFSAGTYLQAATTLRVPVRAQRVGWQYGYGLYSPERDESGIEQRWTDRRSVVVLEAPARYLELTVTPNALAEVLTQRIVVALDGCRVIDERVRSNASVTRLIRVGASRKRILLETYTDRPFRPRDFGLAGERRLGVRVKWRFFDAHPGGDVVANELRPAC